MDLSTFERVFALRDEASKALGAEDLDLPDLSRTDHAGNVVHPSSSPNEKIAASLMKRAVALHEKATKESGKGEEPLRADLDELLQAASAPLPVFEESELATDRPAPAGKSGKGENTGAFAAPAPPPASDESEPVTDRPAPTRKTDTSKKKGAPAAKKKRSRRKR
jgi:hypothetical protein